MFEFAISQQKRHAPSRRFLASMATSIISHFFIVAILIEYPQLLGTGLKNWLSRQPNLLSAAAIKEPSWRTVAFLGDQKGKMQMPSAQTLKQFVYDWEAHKGTGKNPPIRLRWNGEIADARQSKPGPAIKPVPGFQEPKPVPQVASDAPPAVGGTLPPGEGITGNTDSGIRGTAVYLPPPQPSAEPKQIPKKAAETAGMVAPTSIPKDVPGTAPVPDLSKTPGPAPAKNTQPQVFENQQKAIQSEGTGFFDTRGFPLGDYASSIIERVKGNWFIPSNLRNSQGRTTVIFFIDKDGRFTDARIVTSSGSSSLDLAALNAIIGSNPFPPLPKGFPGEHVGAKFVFSYNERQ